MESMERMERIERMEKSKNPPGAYDPYKNRVVENPLSNFGAYIQLLKCAIGTGCLGMPLAFKHAGWLNGLLTGPVLGIIAVYAVHILVKAMNEVCIRKKIPLLTYSEAMKYGMLEGPKCLQSCNRTAAIIVDVFLVVYHFGILAVYVVIVANSFHNFVIAFDYDIAARMYMVMLILPLCLVFCIRDLNHMVPVSAVANCLLLAGYGIVLYYVFGVLPPLSTRKEFGDIYRYPLFFGDFLFSIEAIGVIIAIEAKMAKPKKLLGVFGILNQVMLFVVVLYILSGFFGYWGYGSVLKGNISLTIPRGIPALVCKMLVAVGIYMSYPLQGYIVMDVLWFNYMQRVVSEKRKVLWEYIFRFFLVLYSVFIAVLMKNTETIVTLIGACGLSILGLMFPAILDTCVRYASGDYGPGKIYLLRNIFLFIFGVCGGITGSAAAIMHLIIGDK